MDLYIGTKPVWAEPQHRGDRAETKINGYRVVYEDGYESWSPAETFEAAYRRVDGIQNKLDFGGALYALKRGYAVQRAGWNGKDMWLKLQRPDAGSKMTLPYIFMRTAQGDLVPWLASQTDMLAEDWGLLDVPPPPLMNAAAAVVAKEG